MTAPEVSVVVVNWNGPELLADCFASVWASIGFDDDARSRIELLCVDNASTDDSAVRIGAEHPGVKLLKRDVNNYAAANNDGVAAAQADAVLLLNSDARVDADCIRTLLDALHADATLAAVGPKVVFPDGRVNSTGIEQRSDLYWIDRDEGVADAALAADRRAGNPQDVFGISGCCVLFRKSAWSAVGGQDTAFHMYYEDVDLSLRLKAAGHGLRYVPEARVVHLGHQSINKVEASAGAKGQGEVSLGASQPVSRKDAMGERNRLLVLAAHYPDVFATQVVRSPWFQYATPENLRESLPHMATRLATARGTAMETSDVQLELMLALRDANREFTGELDTKFGEHRNLPKILEEREAWIAKLLHEVARLRIYRLPGRRLKAGERAFLDRLQL